MRERACQGIDIGERLIHVYGRPVIVSRDDIPVVELSRMAIVRSGWSTATWSASAKACCPRCTEAPLMLRIISKVYETLGMAFLKCESCRFFMWADGQVIYILHVVILWAHVYM